MAGPTGLDYAGVLAWMQARNLRPRKRRTLLEQIQIMERTALAEWAERARRESRSNTRSRA